MSVSVRASPPYLAGPGVSEYTKLQSGMVSGQTSRTVVKQERLLNEYTTIEHTKVEEAELMIKNEDPYRYNSESSQMLTEWHSLNLSHG